MKKVIVGVIIIVAVFFIITTFDSGSKRDSNSETVIVGLSAPVTGLPEYGEAFNNGVFMAIEELKAEEKGFSFVFEDNGYDARKSLSAFKKLVEVDNADIVFDWGTTPAQAVAPSVDESGVLYFTVGTDTSVAKQNDYVIRHFYNGEDQAEVLWKYFRSQGIKRLAIVKLEIQFMESIVQALEDSKNPDETVVVIDTVSGFSEIDFRTIIAKLKNQEADFDAVGVFLGAGQISQFYLQANQLGLAKPTFGTDFFDSQTEIDKSQGTMNGAIFPAYDVEEKFREQYVARFGNDVQIAFAANAYDFIHILVEEDIDFTDRDTILNSFRESKRAYEGIVGGYVFTETENDRYFKAPVALKRIENSMFQVVEQ